MVRRQTISYYAIVVGKERGTPMDMVEADECRLDLVALLGEDGANIWHTLTSEEQDAYRKASERFWFSAVIDHASTVFVAFRIHQAAPSLETALTCFEMTTYDKSHIAKKVGCKFGWPYYGGFRAVRVDSATWYRSHRFTSTMDRWWGYQDSPTCEAIFSSRHN